MKTNAKLSIGLAGALCVNLLLPCVSWGGDLAVDNLTVNTSATGVLPTAGIRYVIVEQKATDTDVQRGTKLVTAYQTAKAMNPSANNRITVLIPPGTYDLGANGITLDASYVDLIGMVPARMTTRASDFWSPSKTWAMDPVKCGLTITGSGSWVVNLGTYDVHLANMIIDSTGPLGFRIPYDDASIPMALIEHVYFKAPMSSGHYDGTFRDCVAGDYAFGGLYSSTWGNFEDCVAGDSSFGGFGGYCAGFFVNCTAGDYSFGNGSSAGSYQNCSGGQGCFGTISYGIYKDCAAGNDSFGGEGNNGDWVMASGTYEHCLAGTGSFGAGASGEDFRGSFDRCKAGAGSFGTFNTASDNFTYTPTPADFHIKIKPQGDLSMGTFTADNP